MIAAQELAAKIASVTAQQPDYSLLFVAAFIVFVAGVEHVIGVRK